MQNYIKFYSLLFIFLFLACNDNSVEPYSKGPIADELKSAYEKAEDLSNIRSLLVQKDDILIGEKYFNANSTNKYDVRSVTKSVVSVLTGIALEKGYLTSLNQKLVEFFPNLTGDIANIKIKQLLTMSAGFEADEFVNMQFYISWAYSGNPLNYVLESNVEHTPGSEFHYYSAIPYIMGKIIEIVSEDDLYAFANKYLFTPMEFEKPEWEILTNGGYNGGAGLQLTGKDMIKFGQMMLDGGTYKGKQIVNSDWINESTSFHYHTSLPYQFEKAYGYYWWILTQNGVNVYYANGYGGNFIVCVPDKNLVVTASSAWRNVTVGSNWTDVINLIMNDILPIYINE